MSKDLGGFPPSEANYSKLPHAFIDMLPQITTRSELVILLYILRHTWGFGEYDKPKRITVDEFMHGRKRKDGTRIDNGTGLSKKSVQNGLASAEEHGLITVTTDDDDKARVKKSYALVIRQLENQGDTFYPPDDDRGVKSSPRGVKSTPLTAQGGVKSSHRTEKEIDQKETIEKNTTETSDDVSPEPPDGGPSEDLRPPIFEAPHLYKVSEIQKARLFDAQWQSLLENEQAGLSKYGVRSSVVDHCKHKLEMSPLDRLRAGMQNDMLDAMNAATIQDIAHPGMGGLFRKVFEQLVPSANPGQYYTPKQVWQFASENKPVEQVHYLKTALSAWLGKKQKGQSNGRSATGTATDKPRRRRRYDRDDLAAWRQKHAEQQPAEQQATGQ